MTKEEILKKWGNLCNIEEAFFQNYPEGKNLKDASKMFKSLRSYFKVKSNKDIVCCYLNNMTLHDPYINDICEFFKMYFGISSYYKYLDKKGEIKLEYNKFNDENYEFDYIDIHKIDDYMDIYDKKVFIIDNKGTDSIQHFIYYMCEDSENEIIFVINRDNNGHESIIFPLDDSMMECINEFYEFKEESKSNKEIKKKKCIKPEFESEKIERILDLLKDYDKKIMQNNRIKIIRLLEHYKLLYNKIKEDVINNPTDEPDDIVEDIQDLLMYKIGSIDPDEFCYSYLRDEYLEYLSDKFRGGK